ncbi:methyltransferase domain-containing protein [Candidatus Woesearchaeota archaeon]|nr:methyltransferase domain-containing protein [Candidatus Woesearchaeota archaeon]
MTYYDETSAGYDELHGAEQTRKAREILAYLEQHRLISQHSRLLDVGCGTCISTALFPGDRTGIDPSKELLKRCKDATIKLVHGNAESLPFVDDWFDIVVSLTAVHNFDDVEKGLREMQRVGTNLFVITLLKKSQEHSAIEALIRKLFKVEAELDDPTDKIFVLRKDGDTRPSAARPHHV